jgi:hypothetical protein
MTMWHGRSPVERQYTETLQVANIAAVAVSQAMVLAGFRGRSAAPWIAVFQDFLRCSMILQRNKGLQASLAHLYARNLFVPRKNIEARLPEGLHAPHNCRIENL